MKTAPHDPPPTMPEPTVSFALPKPWPQMTEEEREVYIHESYVALAQRTQR